MKLILLYYPFFLLMALPFASCNFNKQALPSLKETFSKKDKNPFGGYVFYNQLQQIFYHNDLHTEKQNFETVWQNISDTAALYISISKNLYLSEAAQKAMLNYVNRGNTLFISSENIDSSLLDFLGCKADQSFPKTVYLEDMKYTSVSMDRAMYYDTATYTYYYLPFAGYFNKYDTSITNVLGINEKGKANFIEIFYGKGRVYLHCEPRALSNYFLLQHKNYLYLQNLFTLTAKTPEHIYWDDYYNKRNYPASANGSKNAFQLLLQYPATAGAFWLVLLLLALYILFGGKRRQRIVTTIPPNTNTTVAFTETIGRLYLQKKDNSNIAGKMIMYFQEHIRKQYFLNTSHVNDEFITTLSRKSNVPIETTAALFTLVNQLQDAPEISDEQLLFLNRQIDIFYKNNP